VAAPVGARWGWHRLTNQAARHLVARAAVAPGRLVLDIGAGEGAITAALVERGARVVAVELHPDRAAFLRRRFEGQSVVVVQADCRDLRLPRRPFDVVANPPFGGLSQVLRRLLAPGSRLDHAVLAVPLWVAQRWSFEQVRGSTRWRGAYSLSVGPRLPRQAFVPKSPQDIALLEIRRRRSEGPRR
jgi:23S rRNA (adenine-N6)-dimethyltransferase